MKTTPAWTILLFILLLQPVSQGVAMQSNSVAVLISREITPYIQMVEGLETSLRNLDVQRFFLDAQGRPYSLVASSLGLEPEAYSAIVAVGPEALRYLQPRVETAPLLYAMVLNPANVIDPAYPVPCGISLNIPIDAQLAAIRAVLPETRHLGVLFDPDNNAAWYQKAQTAASGMEMHLIPVQVDTRKGRVSIAADYPDLDALLFIPDRSVISKAVIRHVIKNAASYGVPVVGYNSFFYTSGAALVFSIDYAKVGEQGASLVRQVLEQNVCTGDIPAYFATRTNPIVLESLRQYRTQGKRE